MIKVTLPKKPKFIKMEENAGKVEIENCYPGYGTTLGNALRRILLSSLTGAAVTSVKIKGATHEFSTIPGVLEDAIQIILNLKKVRFKVYKDEPVKLTLKEKGVKKITAAQIQCPSDVEVVNKEVPLASITDKKGELEMEIEVQRGLGYVPVEQQEREKKEIGLIAIDAIYTPVRRVNYTVENMRVGKRTDYDKITLEIETDGTVTPEEAFKKSVEIAIAQYEAIVGFEEAEEKTAESADQKKIKAEAREREIFEGEIADKKNLEKDIGSLSFSTRTNNVLEENSIKTINDLISLKEDELKDLEGMGDKGIKEIKKAIGNLGLTLKS